MKYHEALHLLELAASGERGIDVTPPGWPDGWLALAYVRFQGGAVVHSLCVMGPAGDGDVFHTSPHPALDEACAAANAVLRNAGSPREPLQLRIISARREDLNKIAEVAGSHLWPQALGAALAAASNTAMPAQQ